ncbi:MAG: hypothetical protein SFX19_02385 [Alphaproteobacteria bacterium]|nr:hypothetical protein [Alphaproteobacteria bacterium]
MVEDDKQYESNRPGSLWAAIYWWTFLVVAVLAVPSIGFIFAMVIPDKNIGQLVVFVLTCWSCTYLGMRLMKK